MASVTTARFCSHGMMVNEAASARIWQTIFSIFHVNQMLSPGPAREGCLPKVRLMHLITLPWTPKTNNSNQLPSLRWGEEHWLRKPSGGHQARTASFAKCWRPSPLAAWDLSQLRIGAHARSVDWSVQRGQRLTRQSPFRMSTVALEACSRAIHVAYDDATCTPTSHTVKHRAAYCTNRPRKSSMLIR